VILKAFEAELLLVRVQGVESRVAYGVADAAVSPRVIAGGWCVGARHARVYRELIDGSVGPWWTGGCHLRRGAKVVIRALHAGVGVGVVQVESLHQVAFAEFDGLV
jgi:hypothetical protein